MGNEGQVLEGIIARPGRLPADGAGLLDWAAMAKRFDGATVCMDEVMRLLLSTHQDIPAKLRTAAHANDTGAVVALSRYLRTTALFVEAVGLKELAGRTEQLGRMKSPESKGLAEELACLVEQLCAEARLLVAGRSPLGQGGARV